MTLLVTAECVDDLINDVHQAILADGLSNDPTKGSTLEILGAYLVLTDPRRRISRTESRGKLISCLGEFLWYLSAQNDLEFIKHFIPRYAESAESDGKIHGGYGPRLFNMRGLYNQLKNGHCCKVSDEAAFCLIQRPYISKTLLTRRISPRGSP